MFKIIFFSIFCFSNLFSAYFEKVILNDKYLNITKINNETEHLDLKVSSENIDKFQPIQIENKIISNEIIEKKETIKEETKSLIENNINNLEELNNIIK